MKRVEKLDTVELFCRLSTAIYYGPALRCELRTNPRALLAAQALIAELRQDDFLRDKMEEAQA